MAGEFRHVPVLLNETLDSLKIRPDGTYVDCTAGGGGHSAAILERLGANGRLIMIDTDPDAVKVLEERFAGCENATVVHNNYIHIKEVLLSLGIPSADGVLADLGVSSYQLDAGERGFSYHTDAPLDMRMSKTGTSAYDLVNTASVQELTRILYQYGEEKCARSVAAAIERARARKPVETTVELAEIVKSGIPAKLRRTGGHPARKAFQAIRIAVNGELDNLPGAVGDMFDVLAVGGRLSVITFHSLEDRIVKNEFRTFTEGCTCPKEFPICVCGKTARGKVINRGVSPGEDELADNARSRSARLRTIEKIN
ncbi:MAG: 16S rRNA (cytosine(1402)-N(4))-methyltransferase RsmH [Clostridia bacterium]|nr:16S rRNA (cytosine(1402)-N(4))-methyltransferase RsmH [Clostridia bacterium]MBR0536663.1 16S rRNA (cytosine(1402)-N(4))-methyltransferase RsmH [Clostridia bacterium]